jgi:hypothetical protein
MGRKRRTHTVLSLIRNMRPCQRFIRLMPAYASTARLVKTVIRGYTLIFRTLVLETRVLTLASANTSIVSKSRMRCDLTNRKFHHTSQVKIHLNMEDIPRAYAPTLKPESIYHAEMCWSRRTLVSPYSRGCLLERKKGP